MKKILLLSALILGCGGLFAATYSPPLDLQQMKEDPMDQFEVWFKQAQQVEGTWDASIFVLGTVNKACEPSTRSMVAKSIDRKEICFFGDKRSSKFEDISQNPSVSGTFLWLGQQRQVTFMGKAKPVSRGEKQAAFESLSQEAQIATHITEQGEELTSYEELEKEHQALSKQYQNKKVPMPESWEGYCLEPEVILFWQAGENALHSRIIYLQEKGKWTKKLLQP